MIPGDNDDDSDDDSDDDNDDDNDGRGWMSASETASRESRCGRVTAARSPWTGRRTQRLTSCLRTPPS